MATQSLLSSHRSQFKMLGGISIAPCTIYADKPNSLWMLFFFFYLFKKNLVNIINEKKKKKKKKKKITFAIKCHLDCSESLFVEMRTMIGPGGEESGEVNFQWMKIVAYI